MTIPAWLWLATIAGLLVIIGFDFWLVSRRPREPSMRECAIWIACYVGLAALFGAGVLLFAGPVHSGEFFAGWVTEYSLSVDNLFVFVVIMTSFAVPRQKRQQVLLVGIVLALALRGLFIAVGAQAISRFDWLFYVFGAFLVFTAWKLVSSGDAEQEEFHENGVLRLVRRVYPAIRPMLVVMIAIGTTDLLFALDSIPAIFGLTKQPYLVFTANAFALMGLRQLFFLIGGLLDRLVYLSVGLSVVLGFIGLKLIFEALHHDGVSWAPEIPIVVSLAVIVGTLAVTTVASVLKNRRPAREPAADDVAV